MAATTNTSPPGGGHDLLTLLRRELARRCAANAKYSLRAFARDLRIHHSTLSQLLRGRRCLTPAAVKQLGPRLRLDALTVDRLALGACSPGGFQPAALRAARELAGDAFRALAPWPNGRTWRSSSSPGCPSSSRTAASSRACSASRSIRSTSRCSG